MIAESNAARVLIVHDVEETRDSLERLLQKDGYRLEAVRDEEDAVAGAKREAPSLILISLAGPAPQVIATAGRIRERANLSERIPVVVFGLDTVNEGAEVEFGNRLFVIRPENFDQLRNFLSRLLPDRQSPAV